VFGEQDRQQSRGGEAKASQKGQAGRDATTETKIWAGDRAGDAAATETE
jgi:hypothetical protein